MFAVVSYLLHLSFLIVELILIVYLLLTGALALSGLALEDEIIVVLGLHVPQRAKITRYDGTLRLALSLLLALPWLLGVSFLFSGIGAVLALVYLSYREQRNVKHRQWQGIFARLLMIIAAGFVIFATFFEQADAIVLGQHLFTKGFHYQQIEASWHDYYEVTAPNLGDVAPDFELATPDSSEMIRLSDYRGDRPVLLLFGAHT